MTGTPTRRQMIIAPNPAYAGQKPRKLQAACHDRTPFLSVQCTGCADHLHVHESQLDPEGGATGARCPHCRQVMVFEAGLLEEAFAQMRKEGWID